MDFAVVEGDTGTNPLSRLRRQLSRRGEPLAEPVSFVHTGQRQKKPTDKPINLSPLPKPPPSGEVARRSRDGEGCFRNEPSQSRCARQLSRRGEPLAEPASFVHTGQRQKKPTDKPINFSPLPKPPPSGEVARRSRDGEGRFRFAPAPPPCGESLHVRGRWHGEAGTARGAFGPNPLRLAALDSSPEGESPWQNQQVSSTPANGRRSQPISGKLYALAKASPFRERWHGEAVTERVSPRLAAAFGNHFFKSEPGQNREKRLYRHAKNPKPDGLG